MIKYILTVLYLFLSLQDTKAQRLCNLDSLINKFTNVFKEKRIKKYGYTMHYCVGPNRSETVAGVSCHCSEFNYELYVFWELHNKVYLKKYDSCGEFLPTLIQDKHFFDYFRYHSKAIICEEVKSLKALPINENGDTVRTFTKVDHTCLRKLKISIKGKQTEKSFDLSDLIEKDNINYNYNSGLKLVEWSNKTDAIINQLNLEKRFIRKM